MPRIIMHLDMDSYFASVEQQANPSLRGLPVGITGKPIESTIIVTASREGKKFGLKAGMPVWEAKKLCPQLALFPGDGSKYMSITQRFIDILKCYTPIIEVSSIDEVYMDITQEAPHYGGARRLAQSIQRDFKRELGKYITATIGIADNKTFSKLIAKRHKP
ncbi:DNA polymerase IV, partial [Candidatus Bipolaricaulota bacterium]|nr:DNA polymerase IV [Candidatus Bipolaricaulota bacterium]